MPQVPVERQLLPSAEFERVKFQSNHRRWFAEGSGADCARAERLGEAHPLRLHRDAKPLSNPHPKFEVEAEGPKQNLGALHQVDRDQQPGRPPIRHKKAQGAFDQSRSHEPLTQFTLSQIHNPVQG